jgi:hypothetical protein
MEVQDGFIVGIYNYCDRWCETCAFTSRCRLFADVAETEAESDPNLKAVVDAPPLPQDVPPPPPTWMQELIDEMNEAASDPKAAEVFEEYERSRSKPPAEHLVIEQRAEDYGTRAHAWLRARESSLSSDPRDPQSVIDWFHLQILVKAHRALSGLAEFGPEDLGFPPDYDGSAKVALIGIDRSHAAWLDLVERGIVPDGEAAPFVADLVWLGDQLDIVFPKARAFVRPGLDEPDDVAMLDVKERAE